MLISYWDCKYREFCDTWNGEDEVRVYLCTHPDKDGVCDADNMHTKEYCNLAEKQRPHCYYHAGPLTMQ